jgi:trehalose 6-phosphate synthase/phosphatase
LSGLILDRKGHMSRLINISNRLPFTVEQKEEGLCVRQSSGGLVSAIKSYFEKAEAGAQSFHSKVWVGSVDTDDDTWELAKGQGLLPDDFVIEPVFPDAKEYELYYNGFSNSTLWPLFHYFPSLTEYKKESFEAYKKINELFAEKIAAVYQPGDLIWVHDYQLMLLPHLIRKKIPDAAIGFFLHIPFPSYELFRLLPTQWKKDLVEGVLGADLVGFHTHDYVQYFIQSAKMILHAESQYNTLNYDNRSVQIDLFPIGIDYQKFRDACTDETVVAIATKLEEKFYNQRLVFSVDRLDYTKGLEYRLDAYDLFLQEYPQWREKVTFVLNVIPSRDAIQTYLNRKKNIEEKVSTINGKYSTLQWQPLLYRYNHLGFDELCALYQTADVALITPLRDGMNLVAKEYIASTIDKGVLILSELTGAASELNEALLVNPTDLNEVAANIDTALTMPAIEQRSRISYMKKRLQDYDVFKWISEFLNTLVAVKKEQVQQQGRILSSSAIGKILSAYRSADKRCLLLDYDGTLTPIQKIPSMAKPSQGALQLLEQLSSSPQNEVIVISGRDAATLGEWLGHLPITLVAEHGAFVRMKGEDWKETVSIGTEWKDQVRPLMQLFVDRCAGSFTEEKKNTLAWHYRNTHPELGFNRSRELKNSLAQLLANTPLQVVDGNKVLEVRMTGVDKGASALNIINHLQPQFILCIGDDTTDEDMFRMLRDKGFTIKVCKGTTAAEYTIMSQKEVIPFLQLLANPVTADINH